MKKVRMFEADSLYMLEAKLNIFLKDCSNIKNEQITYQMSTTGSNRYGVRYSAMIIYDDPEPLEMAQNQD